MRQSILLISMLTLFASCESQIGTAISTTFTNIFSGKAFHDSASDVVYEEYKKEAELNPVNTTNVSCDVPDRNSNSSNLSNIFGLSKIKDKLCTCKTWGTCDSKSCSCGFLCPDNFSILNRSGLAKNDSEDNSLAFTNGDSAFYNNDPTYQGYCWGHAVLTQRFNRLAVFNPEMPAPVFNKREGADEQRINYYKSIISRINNNEPVDIPGFKNLKEFSSDPEVKALLQDSVKSIWAENAMSAQGLKMIAGSDPQGAEYYTKVFDDVEYRLKNFQSPAIVFNESGESTKTHTVLVSGSGVDPKTGERFLCLRDNNFKPSQTINCAKKMILKANGNCYYEGWKAVVGKVTVAHSENTNTVEQVKNLRSKCADDHGCPNK